jgi:hypothetical protein
MNNKIPIYLVNVLIGEKGGVYSIDNMIATDQKIIWQADKDISCTL